MGHVGLWGMQSTALLLIAREMHDAKIQHVFVCALFGRGHATVKTC